ncbi:MAG: choice-of-anchor B domain-containing protein [Flavobacteriales bacterium]|jgi:choice-of-anchor B domain-containing protein
MKNLFILILLLSPFLATAQPQEGVLLGTWSNPDLVGSSAYDNTYNEIWGHAANDREYAIIGSTAGTHFIDVTDPVNPSEVAFVEGGQMGPVVIHRDYHNYGEYLYAVCDEGGASTLQIIDLSDLPNSVEVVYDDNELITRAHNIFIDEATARLYALATANSNGFRAMSIFDISNPTAPTLLASHNTFGGNTVGHVHDAYVKNNLAYLNCGNDGLYVVDFSDVNNPTTLGSMTDYLQSGYNHSGWASEDGNYYYFADETHGMDVKAVDVSDFSDMTITSFFDAGPQAASTSIPHNQIVAGNFLYLSYYYDGVQVYDLTDPANPERVLFYNTSSEADGDNYKGAWGIYPFLPSGNILISDMQTGFTVIEGPTPIPSGLTTENGNILLEVFPQPAKEQLNLRINLVNNGQDSQLQMIDLMGRTLFTKKLNLNAGQNDFSIDEINSLPNGYYILKLQGTDWELTERVIVGR